MWSKQKKNYAVQIIAVLVKRLKAYLNVDMFGRWVQNIMKNESRLNAIYVRRFVQTILGPVKWFDSISQYRSFKWYFQMKQ